MDYTAIAKNTWTKVVDATDGAVVIQCQRPSALQFSFGLPSASESGFTLNGGDILTLNGGTYGEDLYVLCKVPNVIIVSNNGGGSSNTIISGSWIPTITGAGGFTSAVLRSARYTQVGSIVTCSCVFEVTASDTNFTVELTPPVASNFATAFDATGVGGINQSVTPSVTVNSNASTNNIALICNPVVNPDEVWIICQYTVI
jgi:hypothetical protein